MREGEIEREEGKERDTLLCLQYFKISYKQIQQVGRCEVSLNRPDRIYGPQKNF